MCKGKTIQDRRGHRKEDRSKHVCERKRQERRTEPSGAEQLQRTCQKCAVHTGLMTQLSSDSVHTSVWGVRIAVVDEEGNPSKGVLNDSASSPRSNTHAIKRQREI